MLKGMHRESRSSPPRPNQYKSPVMSFQQPMEEQYYGFNGHMDPMNGRHDRILSQQEELANLLRSHSTQPTSRSIPVKQMPRDDLNERYQVGLIAVSAYKELIFLFRMDKKHLGPLEDHRNRKRRHQNVLLLKISNDRWLRRCCNNVSRFIYGVEHCRLITFTVGQQQMEKAQEGQAAAKAQHANLVLPLVC